MSSFLDQTELANLVVSNMRTEGVIGGGIAKKQRSKQKSFNESLPSTSRYSCLKHLRIPAGTLRYFFSHFSDGFCSIEGQLRNRSFKYQKYGRNIKPFFHKDGSSNAPNLETIALQGIAFPDYSSLSRMCDLVPHIVFFFKKVIPKHRNLKRLSIEVTDHSPGFSVGHGRDRRWIPLPIAQEKVMIDFKVNDGRITEVSSTVRYKTFREEHFEEVNLGENEYDIPWPQSSVDLLSKSAIRRLRKRMQDTGSRLSSEVLMNCFFNYLKTDIQSLSFDVVKAEEVVLLMRSLEGVESVCLKNIFCNWDIPEFSWVNNKKIKNVVIENCDGPKTIKNLFFFSDADSSNTLRSLTPNLETLKLVNVENIDDIGLSQIIDSHPHLKHITIKNCYNISSKVIDQYKKKLGKKFIVKFGS